MAAVRFGAERVLVLTAARLAATAGFFATADLVLALLALLMDLCIGVGGKVRGGLWGLVARKQSQAAIGETGAQYMS